MSGRRSDVLLERVRMAQDLRAKKLAEQHGEDAVVFAGDGHPVELVPALVELLVDIRDAMAGPGEAGTFRLPARAGGEVNLSTLETELEKLLARYQLGGRAGPLAKEVLLLVRQWIGRYQ